MLREKIWNYIIEHKLIFSGETVLVGVSGGADSVCLLLLLSELGREKGFQVRAVHVNHNLRGAESDGDQAFTEELCNRIGIPLHCYSFPVDMMSREMQMGIEEAGRAARMMAFRQCMDETGAEKTALAHHKNDQAETVLFRLARGSSLSGLSGIRPQQGRIIHPLLFADKDQILEVLESRGVSYRTDSSNLTEHYTRNCIRRQIMPILEEKVNRNSIAHIAEAAEDIAEAENFIKKYAETVEKGCLEKSEDFLLIRKELQQEEAVIRRYVLMDALSLAAGGRKNLGREQVSQLQDLLEGKTGRRSSLPANLEAVRVYDGVILRVKQAEKVSEEPLCRISFPDQSMHTPGDCHFGKWRIRWEILSEAPTEIPEKAYTKWLDYDKINKGLEFRTRKPGDFLVITQTGGRKKLKSYFIDEKIPSEERREVPLLVSGSRVFWVVGHRISEDCKITEQTKQVLKITVLEEKP